MAASKPTFWLSLAMDAVFMALSRNFGTLTRRWVVSLMDTSLTPDALTTPSLQRPHVRSLTASRGLSPPKPTISSSTTRTTSSEICLRAVSAGTSYFRSRLDFHPYTQVTRTICTSVTLRSSTPLSKGFNLPRHRSTGFGYRRSDSWRAHHPPRNAAGIRFPYGFPVLPVNLARPRNSLARFSKRKIRRCLRFHALSVCKQLVSRPFHLPQGVLCNVHSRYYCAIGLR